jgi:3-phosphoshikimate 1-carboxyvinyltransferase
MDIKTITSPSSKSITQRAIAAASLTNGKSVILNPAFCKDTEAALRIAHTLGATVEQEKHRFTIQGSRNFSSNSVNVGESGLALRMFAPIAAISDKSLIMTGEGSLLHRPVDMIADALTQGGIHCSTNNGFLPLSISGKLHNGIFRIDASVTSQLLTGLLMALPLLDGTSIVMVDNLKSKPYIDMTIELLERFGIDIQNEDDKIFTIKGNQTYQSCEVIVEGDWSGAAFWMVAGAIYHDVCISGLNAHSKQADRMILDALECAHCCVLYENNNFISRKSTVSPFSFDATNCPDLIPALTLLAACAKGVSHISGALRLQYKESDRAAVLISEFKKLGISITQQDDILSITGGVIKGGAIDSYNDHRIAMTFAIASLISESAIAIKNPECVNKSYPDFFQHLTYLKHKIDIAHIT